MIHQINSRFAKFIPLSTAARLAQTPAKGVPVYDTELDKLFIGDGATAGGIEVSGSGGGSGGVTTGVLKLSPYVEGQNVCEISDQITTLFIDGPDSEEFNATVNLAAGVTLQPGARLDILYFANDNSINTQLNFNEEDFGTELPQITLRRDTEQYTLIWTGTGWRTLNGFLDGLSDAALPLYGTFEQRSGVINAPTAADFKLLFALMAPASFIPGVPALVLRTDAGTLTAQLKQNSTNVGAPVNVGSIASSQLVPSEQVKLITDDDVNLTLSSVSGVGKLYWSLRWMRGW